MNLRILLDHSVAAIFTASGRTLTVRLYLTGDGPCRVQMSSTGAAAPAYAVSSPSDTSVADSTD